MGKSNLAKNIERAFADQGLWCFISDMVQYYLMLRGYKYEDLSRAIGYSNPCSVSNLRFGQFTPEQIEKIIVFLNIENEDANRIRAKYWSALCGQDIHNCMFNRLFADNVESTIRELRFEVNNLRRKIESIDTRTEIQKVVDSFWEQSNSKNIKP